MTHLQRFQKALADAGFDAAVISSEVNQRWLTHFPIQDGLIIVTPDKGYMLTDFRYIEAANASKAAEEFEILMPEPPLAKTANEIFNNNKSVKIALEEATLPIFEAEVLKKIFENKNVTGGASKIIDGLREFKDEEEIKTMITAQAITDKAFSHIIEWITPDKTEKEVSLEIEFFMRAHGAEAAAFDTIAVSGKASSLPHGVPRDVKLEKGFLTMDFGARVDGYDSDMTRTIVIGKADADIRKLYNTVLEAQTAVLKEIGPGKSNRQMHMIADRIINEAGYKGCFGHGLGHGVGMYIHEPPRMNHRLSDDIVLLPGQTVTVEPGIYLAGKYGCRIEDMIVILKDGYYNFTKSSKDLVEIY